MKLILKISKIELCKLFSSPVAWFILIIFSIQFGVQYCEILIRPVKDQALGDPWQNLTSELFWERFSYILNYLYFYIPLLTMGLMSKEYGSGSIKLLYSSPITDVQIIFGKYIAMMIFGLFMIGVLLPYVIFTAFVVENTDLWYVFSNLLGMFLLICAYASVGLFISSLTSNQVVSAIGTLVALTFINLIGRVGDDISVIQDMTYWLSFSNKTQSFVDGIISTENIIYFLTVVGLFVTLTLWVLKRKRKKEKKSLLFVKYTGLLLVVLSIGYGASRPILTFYWDTTYSKSNTISSITQDLLEKLDGKLRLVTYVNILGKYYEWGLPGNHKMNFEEFRKYIRFKPDLKMEYVYYYDSTQNSMSEELYPNMSPKEVATKICKAKHLDFDQVLSSEELYKHVDLSKEKEQLVRQFIWKDSVSVFLRLFNDSRVKPREQEVAIALKSLSAGLVNVGYVIGHGEHQLYSIGSAGYYRFFCSPSERGSLINQGYNVYELLLQEHEIPVNTDIIVIAGSKENFLPEELQKIERYIETGGNILILGDNGTAGSLNPVLKNIGVQLLDKPLQQTYDNQESDLITANLTLNAKQLNDDFNWMFQTGSQMVAPGCVGLTITNKGFNYLPIIRTNSSTYVLDEKDAGLSYPILVALERSFGNFQQRIVVSGDADWLSNGELCRIRDGFYNGNLALKKAIFKWLGNDRYPIKLVYTHTIDNHISLKRRDIFWVKIFALGVYPLILLVVLVIYRNKRKRK